MARARRGRGLRIEGEDIIRSAVTVVKSADLGIEMVGFIEAAKRNILSFPRAILRSYEE